MSKKTSRHLAQLILTQRGRCGLCGEHLGYQVKGEITIDHILPKSRGGTNAIGNLQATHIRCNQKKGDGC